MKNRNKTYYHHICFCFCFVLFFLSCSKKDVESDKQIFRYNEISNISSLDPAFAKDQAMIWADNQIYNGLLQLDSNLDIQPCIAKSYEISEDGLLYTFHLRNDVYFHKNPCFNNLTRKVTAEDFVYSFNRIVSEKVASPGLWIFKNVAKTNNSYAFLAINDSTLQIRLENAFAPFLGLLTMPYAFVVPKEAVEYYGDDFRKNPVGTGAFYFKYWKEGVKLVLLRNENYFEKDKNGKQLPYLDAVNISFIV
ncbi:MAG: ABC transporter substrate-binding protein, partial [Bacteroidota bacterium]|nr:ABC transporter substrate-binding protein [Bacteroidota bacterium]